MGILQKHIAFVNEQFGIQTKLAAKYHHQEWREKLHSDAAEKFRTMALALVEADRLLDDYATAASQRPELKPNRLVLSHDEIADLPEALRAELSYSGYDKTEEALVQAIKDNGGIASLDQLLVAVFRKTGEIFKRTTLTSRLYRMAQKGYLFSVPNKKGVYSIVPLSDAEAAQVLAPLGTDDAGGAGS